MERYKNQLAPLELINIMSARGIFEVNEYVGDLTLTEIQTFLREKHKLFIYCQPKGFEKGNGRKVIRWSNNLSIRENKFYSTYEKALYGGIKEVFLKNPIFN